MSSSATSSAAKLAYALLITVGALVLFASACEAMSVAEQANEQAAMRQAPAASLAVVENPELTARVLESLLRSVVYSASANELQSITNGAQKRGLDLGISRGFSGSQAGKHLMGLSAASFANGPGRR